MPNPNDKLPEGTPIGTDEQGKPIYEAGNSPRELLEEELTNELKWCGCGDPDAALCFLHDLLKEMRGWSNRAKGEDYKPYYERIGALLHQKESPGLYYAVLYFLDAADITEHGGSVNGSWLSGKGDLLLDKLERYMKLRQ